MKDKDTSAAKWRGCTKFTVGGISLSPDCDSREAVDIVAKRLRRAGIDPARLDLSIFKRSVDARKKKDVRLVYSVLVSDKEGRELPASALSRLEGQVTAISESQPMLTCGSEQSEYPPLVVGMGPAGLFCALLLAEQGYKPCIIDRGDGIAERCGKTKIFFERGELDTESNIQFGAGGAGTFSDGKLVTRVGDGRVSYVLRRFCDFGAPADILINAKPHIGTDLLVGTVDRMLLRITELGGRVIYRCRLTSIDDSHGDYIRAVTTEGDIFCSSLVLAAGHSANDIYSEVLERGYAVEPKPFSLGVRIEHLQSDIDRALLGDFAGHPKLGKGEYHLSDTSGRGVYTFCMCPGGEVVGAASEQGGVVVNGMSNNARDGRNANSAVLVSVRPEDYGNDCRCAIELRRELERAAFAAGGGDFYAPCQTVGDFLAGGGGSEPCRIMPTYRGGKVRLARLDGLLPKYVSDEIKVGLMSFERKLCGFSAADAVLTGVETRSSAPLRILRGSELCALGHSRVYPCGEGAGYAGGITSAAVDGIKVAEKIISRFDARGVRA